MGVFSPRARGCSSFFFCSSAFLLVFPACAGMFLARVLRPGQMLCFPRVRGDVPFWQMDARWEDQFSPRARGCSSVHLAQGPLEVVFPACAGMFRRKPRSRCWPCGFPRVRGDVPDTNIDLRFPRKFSPRARGCSRGFRTLKRTHGVFPACAGMFRRGGVCFITWTGFPRVRGDVPSFHLAADQATRFSPRARGCSQHPRRRPIKSQVFPACAGMFR